MQPRILPFGEAALLVELERRIDPLVAARAAALADRWEALGRGPAVPTYASVLLRWDPLVTVAEAARREAETILASLGDVRPLGKGRLVEVPTRYDGPDLDDVARASGLSAREVVRAHTSRDHVAYFVGFMPGFAYCAGVDERIVAPRLASPRARVPAGSVAVADGQTAVYPADSPGGWRLLGHTDLVAFDASRDEPALVRPGDRVRFVAL
ncbi:MAG: 5-oxoprolinase subunit PxpB [Chloroflexota bacterium]|nr:5-oxoprolinase subunit PxpB [Chloroflexota bacterium]